MKRVLQGSVFGPSLLLDSRWLRMDLLKKLEIVEIIWTF